MLVEVGQKQPKKGLEMTAGRVNVPTETTPNSRDAHVTADNSVAGTATLVKTEIRACPHCGQALLEPETLRLDEIPGQEQAKRAVEVACAGSHSISFIGEDTETAWQLANWALQHGAQAAYLESVPYLGTGTITDITVEVAPPYPDNPRPEPDENILQRIGEKVDEVSCKMEGHVKDLIELAQRRFRLTHNQQRRPRPLLTLRPFAQCLKRSSQ